MVRVRDRNFSVWIFAGFMCLLSIWLFSVLRTPDESSDSTATGATIAVQPEVVPALELPERETVVERSALDSALPTAPDVFQSTPAQVRPQRTAPAPSRSPPTSYNPVNSSPVPSAPPAIYEPPPPLPSSADGHVRTISGPRATNERAGASRLGNPSVTVTQGTLITAVLETGINTSRPGPVRAMVTKDVHGFDGSKLLIPRGSRLHGTYDALIASGQNRVQIRWTRLVRPDGVTMNLDSPASDAVGQAGIKGKVNSHLLTRIGNALIGSASGIGQALLSRGGAPVIVATSGQHAVAGVQPSPEQVRSTITVRQGTRVSVFVQRDLDFAAVEPGNE